MYQAGPVELLVCAELSEVLRHLRIGRSLNKISFFSQIWYTSIFGRLYCGLRLQVEEESLISVCRIKSERSSVLLGLSCPI